MSSVSMMPATLWDDLPTSQPKKTGRPYLMS
jgi:hypothetical protein